MELEIFRLWMNDRKENNDTMENKKVLLVATIGYFFPQFELNNIAILKSLGYEVHCAADFTVPISEKRIRELKESEVELHQIDFTRNPLRIIQNIKTYQQLNALIKKEKFTLIHCHTPVAGAIARLSAHHCGVKNVIYTAHGFHFYHGGPLRNWFVFYIIEKLLSCFTRIQITINQDDYNIAKERFHAKEVQYVPGVGISLEESFLKESIPRSLKEKHILPNVSQVRHSLGVQEHELMVISVGELIDRKNHRMVMQALAEYHDYSIQYFILGSGKNESEYRKLIQKLHMEKKIHLLGYRDDVMAINQAADLFVFPSFQEGLPLALMEAMREKTPMIVSDIRGNRELVVNPERRFDPKSKQDFLRCFRKAMSKLHQNAMAEDVRQNLDNLKNFSKEKVGEKMKKIYLSTEDE